MKYLVGLVLLLSLVSCGDPEEKPVESGTVDESIPCQIAMESAVNGDTPAIQHEGYVAMKKYCPR